VRLPDIASEDVARSGAKPGPDALRLPPEAESAGLARRYVRDRLATLGRSDVEECAVLGVDELVANVFRHARTPLVLTVRLARGRRVRIEVTDFSNARPVRQDVATFALGGRGLTLLDACGAWGVGDPLKTGGKTIWFEPSPSMNGLRRR
jgi:anti-sigma regulatory factor (Ser/Thr protein kinase)